MLFQGAFTANPLKNQTGRFVFAQNKSLRNPPEWAWTKLIQSRNTDVKLNENQLNPSML